MVHRNTVGVSPVFSTLSTALTSKVCSPSDRLVNWIGVSQVENDEPSIEHSKRSKPTPISEPEKVKVIDLDELFPPLLTLLLLPSIAELIVVSGGVASTFHLNGA